MGDQEKLQEQPAVIIEHLTKKFGAFTAVDDISFTVNRGEIFGFLGANGAGKSTTIRMLCGILKPTSGRGIVGGVDISKTPEEVKTFIGYMSQKFSLYDDLTIE
ncbi:MAG: ATP-binding cassette domain-containing protein, partial [Candidatus Sabulitectum sp.]|nr:ATP-binding cassette domain-containing protein [Candidatus Sabulitectum sp.]